MISKSPTSTTDFPRDQADFNARVEAHKLWARQHFNFDQALHAYAAYRVVAEISGSELDSVTLEKRELLQILDQLIANTTAELPVLRDAAELYQQLPSLLREALQTGLNVAKSKATKRARNAANALHARPGGNRDKQKAIRETWATGKYSSRDVCAEQECAQLEMSFSAARKALRNVPKST